MDHSFVDGDVHHPFRGFERAAEHWEEPSAQMVFSSVFQRYGDLIGPSGGRVLLSGIGAEATVLTEDPEPVHFVDLLRARRFAEFRRELKAWRRELEIPLSNLLIDGLVKPVFAPGRVRFFGADSYRVPPWVDRGFAKRLGLVERARYQWTDRVFDSPARQWQFERIGRIGSFLMRGLPEQQHDLRYPFLHRPLVELMLGLPFERKVRPGRPKDLLRRAMRGILPEPIRNRFDNCTTGHAIYLAIDKDWDRIEPMVEEPLLASLGIVDRARLGEAMSLARLGHCDDLSMLISTLALESWLRWQLDGAAQVAPLTGGVAKAAGGSR